MSRRIKQFFLLIGDITVLYSSLWLALWVRGLVRYWGSPGSLVFSEHVPVFTFIFALWLLVFFVFGLYSLSSAWNIARTLRGFGSAMIVNLALAVFFFYFAPFFALTPKTILFIQVGLVAVVFVIWRAAYSVLLRRVGSASSLVLVGSGAASLELARNLINHPELG